MPAPTNAPYTGGSASDPAAKLFHVDGDFTQADPCGPPIISTPFKGDSIPGGKAAAMLVSTATGLTYQEVPYGTYPIVTTSAANQTAIIIEQEFMVAQAYHSPMPLNTPYNPAWAIGWLNTYASLESCVLVEEGPLEDVGGGIVKFKRRFANVPQSRNEWESFNYTFPAFTTTLGKTRQAFNLTYRSRVQFDYILVGTGTTNADISAITIFPPLMLFADEATATTAMLLQGPEVPLQDPVVGVSVGSLPTASQYQGWVLTGKEVVVEGSILRRWMGNIFERRTRFMVAQ